MFKNFFSVCNYCSTGHYSGGGEFGIVYEGKLRKEIPVAVKTARSESSSEKLQILLYEIKTMLLIGHNPNVITFYGAVIENILKGKMPDKEPHNIRIGNSMIVIVLITSGEVFMVLELCKGGNLKDYLIKATPFFK